VGRVAEIDLAARLIRENRLVTMTGPGGAGKTRLALRVADHVSESFADGICFVALDALQDPELLTQAVAAELGLRDMLEDPIHGVVSFLRDKTMLLVLDNCEHLVDACGMLVGKVLAAAPRVRVLATSRHVLSIEGEYLLPVRPLPVPRYVDGEYVGESDAVVLFAHRAKAASPRFELTPANYETVVTVCQRLDGMPLAIELAAAWLRVLPLHDLLARIDNRFALLARGSSLKASRQRTLSATVDWSYDLCSPEERTLWARLSVFKGGFSLAAVEAVCSGGPIEQSDVLMIIAGLVDKSVVAREGYNGSARYWMLETIHQYGRDRLAESGQEREFRIRHCRYFLELARSIADDWYCARQLEYMAKARREHANFRAALEFGLSDQAAGADGAWLAVRLHIFWINCGYVGEGRRWLDRVLALEDIPDELRVHGFWVSAYASAVLGDHVTALRMGEQAVDLARELGETELLALALYGQGTASLIGAQYSQADACYGESISLYHQIDAPGGRLFPPYPARAMVAGLTGNAELAETLARRGVEFLSERGELWARSYGHYALALAKWLQGDLKTAFEHAAQCVRLAVKFNDGILFALMAEVLAGAAVQSGRRSRAACILGLVERTWLQVGGALLTGGAAWLEPHRAYVAELRKSMGEEAFTSAFDVGAARGTSLEAAAEFLLERLDEDQDPLTKREMDVATWVAQGKTNKEIATALSISPRTVEVHIDHILRKLGFASRVQIGIWAASRIPGVKG
jgi:non-specific serine/threonine protein kinase